MKVKMIYVSPELIATMLTTGYVLKGELTVTDGLPLGATLVGTGYDINRRAWALDFSHDSFVWINDGAVPPEINVAIERKSAVIADALSE